MFSNISLRKCETIGHKLVLVQGGRAAVSDGAYQHPAVEADAECQVKGGEHQQSSESLQQQRHQADLEHVGVEHHQQDDDQVE